MAGPSNKPFEISKHVVWEAYRRVAANKGAAGVDGMSIADFEENLQNNLYKIWSLIQNGDNDVASEVLRDIRRRQFSDALMRRA